MAKGRKTGGRDWQKGQSGNLKGGPGVPRALKEQLKLNKKELDRILNTYSFLSPGETKAHINPETPNLEHMIASLVAIAIETGCQHRLEWLVSRLVGKVKDQVEVTAVPFCVTKLDGSQVLMGSKVEGE